MQIDEEYFNNEEFRQNLKSYEDSVKSGHPIFMDADDLTDIIDYYNMMHQDKKAEETADYALSLFPGASGPITYKVRRYIDANELDKAEELVENVSDKDIDYRFIKAEICIAKNDPDEADQLFEEVMDIADEDDSDNCILDAVNIFFDYGYYEQAYKWIKKVEDKSTDDYIELKVKVMSSMGIIDKVEKMLNKIIDNNPYEHKYWNMLSFAQLLNDKVTDALSSSEYSLAVSPDNPGGIMCKAQALCKMFQFEEAAKYYERYAEYHPNDANSQLQIGYCYMNVSNNEGAILAYKKAERLAAENEEILSSIYENLALAYSHLSDSATALSYIDKLEALGDIVDKHHIELLKGYVFLETGKSKDGIFALAGLLEDSNYDPIYVLKVSVVLYENHFIDASYALMRDNYPLNDDMTLFGFSYYALYCYDLGKEEEFLKYLEKAVDRNPEEAEMALHHLFPDGMRPSEYVEYVKNKYKE